MNKTGALELRSIFSPLKTGSALCCKALVIVLLLTRSTAFWITCSSVYGSSRWLLPSALTLSWPWRLNLEFKASVNLASRHHTKWSTSSLFLVIAGGLKHFCAVKRNFLLKSNKCSSSARSISGVSRQSYLSCSMEPCSSIVISGYSILRRFIKLSQSPCSYSSKLVH